MKTESVSLNTSIGKIDPKQSTDAIVGGIGDIRGVGGILSVNNALSGIGVTVTKIEVCCVNKGNQTSSISTLVTARVSTAKVNQGIELFDVGKPPVCMPGQVQIFTIGLRFWVCQFVICVNPVSVDFSEY